MLLLLMFVSNPLGGFCKLLSFAAKLRPDLNEDDVSLANVLCKFQTVALLFLIRLKVPTILSKRVTLSLNGTA